MKRNTSLMKTVYVGKIQEWHDELEKHKFLNKSEMYYFYSSNFISQQRRKC